VQDVEKMWAFYLSTAQGASFPLITGLALGKPCELGVFDLKISSPSAKVLGVVHAVPINAEYPARVKSGWERGLARGTDLTRE
jgi:hypothetical protein